MRLLDGPCEGAIAVTVTSLEMTRPDELVPVPVIPEGAHWQRVDNSKAQVSRDFYLRVGEPWHWVDRRDWADAQWGAWTDRPEHHLLVCEQDGQAAG